MEISSWQRWSKCCMSLANEDYTEMEVGDDIQAYYWYCTKCEKPCETYQPFRYVKHHMELVSHKETTKKYNDPYYNKYDLITTVDEVWKCSRCERESSINELFSYCYTESFDTVTKSYNHKTLCDSHSHK